MRSQTESVLRANLHRQVDQAYQIADAIYRQQKGKRPDREIQRLIVEALRPLRFFDGRGYFFVDDLDGNCILLPIRPELEGRSLQGNRDDRGAPIMTDWLVSGEAPADFTVDRDCELRSPLEEKATVRYVRHPLDGTEIREHIVAGKVPTRLALTWKDRLSFVLTDKLEIKRLAFLDIIKEEAETQAETAAEQFDADFTLMTGELARFLPDLVAALGGEASLS